MPPDIVLADLASHVAERFEQIGERGILIGQALFGAGQTDSEPLRAIVKSENALPITLHADDDSALFSRLVVQRLGEGADFGVGQAERRAIGVFALCVVVQHQHREPRAVAGLGIFQHLPVAGRVAERGIGPAPDHQMDALRLAGVVVVQQQLGFLGKKRQAALVIAVACAAGGADRLLGGMPYISSAYTRTKSWPPPVTM